MVEEEFLDRKHENQSKERFAMRLHSNFLTPTEPVQQVESKESDSFLANGSSLDGSLQNNPLCEIVEKYSNLRRTHL